MHPHITTEAVHAASKAWHQKYRTEPYDPELDRHPMMVEVLEAARPHMT